MKNNIKTLLKDSDTWHFLGIKVVIITSTVALLISFNIL
jgi:hypothetical protein